MKGLIWALSLIWLNMSYDSQKLKQNHRENRARAIDLLGGKCVRCGSTDRLEFDHINNDRGAKHNCLSSLFRYSWDRVVLELSKCQILCRGCHALKTAEDMGFDVSGSHGSLSTYNNKKCRCDDCRRAMREWSNKWKTNNRDRYLEMKKREHVVKQAKKQSAMLSLS